MSLHIQFVNTSDDNFGREGHEDYETELCCSAATVCFKAPAGCFNVVVEGLAFVLRIREAPGSNSCLDPSYHDRGFWWFSSGHPEKCWISTLKLATTAYFHIIIQSSQNWVVRTLCCWNSQRMSQLGVYLTLGKTTKSPDQKSLLWELKPLNLLCETERIGLIAKRLVWVHKFLDVYLAYFRDLLSDSSAKGGGIYQFSS
jgi:hypothetical protein